MLRLLQAGAALGRGNTKPSPSAIAVPNLKERVEIWKAYMEKLATEIEPAWRRNDDPSLYTKQLNVDQEKMQKWKFKADAAPPSTDDFQWMRYVAGFSEVVHGELGSGGAMYRFETPINDESITSGEGSKLVQRHYYYLTTDGIFYLQNNNEKWLGEENIKPNAAAWNRFEIETLNLVVTVDEAPVHAPAEQKWQFLSRDGAKEMLETAMLPKSVPAVPVRKKNQGGGASKQEQENVETRKKINELSAKYLWPQEVFPPSSQTADAPVGKVSMALQWKAWMLYLNGRVSGPLLNVDPKTTAKWSFAPERVPPTGYNWIRADNAAEGKGWVHRAGEELAPGGTMYRFEWKNNAGHVYFYTCSRQKNVYYLDAAGEELLPLSGAADSGTTSERHSRHGLDPYLVWGPHSHLTEDEFTRVSGVQVNTSPPIRVPWPKGFSAASSDETKGKTWENHMRNLANELEPAYVTEGFDGVQKNWLNVDQSAMKKWEFTSRPPNGVAFDVDNPKHITQPRDGSPEAPCTMYRFRRKTSPNGPQGSHEYRSYSPIRNDYYYHYYYYYFCPTEDSILRLRRRSTGSYNSNDWDLFESHYLADKNGVKTVSASVKWQSVGGFWYPWPDEVDHGVSEGGTSSSFFQNVAADSHFNQPVLPFGFDVAQVGLAAFLAALVLLACLLWFIRFRYCSAGAASEPESTVGDLKLENSAGWNLGLLLKRCCCCSARSSVSEQKSLVCNLKTEGNEGWKYDEMLKKATSLDWHGAEERRDPKANTGWKYDKTKNAKASSLDSYGATWKASDGCENIPEEV
ncbi:unnamed protein product [Amoebophrya sp. A25]|nr:unnamed protein product [Amoebophrya sp. A25]|eukprot:GSA25T00002872001.1